MATNAYSPATPTNIARNLAPISNVVNNVKNMGSNAVNSMKSFGTTAFNSMKNLGTTAANSVANLGTTAANSVANLGSTAVNSVANLGSTAANSMTNLGKSFGKSNSGTGNTFKSLNASVSVPLEEAIAAIPSDAPSLSVSLPLILGIGTLVILFTLFVVFRQKIAAGLQSAYTSVTNYMSPTATVAEQPQPIVPPIEQPSVSLQPSDGEKVIPSAQSVINKIVPGRKTVFNVSPNKYTYSDAEPLCKALGAELATYDQVKNAWDDGADWCNYGWVKGQTAVYPTQQKTFDSLQTSSSDDERMSCGLPGINGGYMDNPELRFGVNCYGSKPAEKDADIRNINSKGDIPLTNEVLEQRKKELRYRNEANQIPILPFNSTGW